MVVVHGAQSGTAQRNYMETPPSVPPLAGKGIGVRCIASRVAFNGRKLGLLLAQTGSRDVECDLFGREGVRAGAEG